MSALWTRRGLMGVVAGIGATALARPALAQGSSAPGGTLARVKAAGVLKVGLADNIPWSKLNPDGSLTGIAPLTVIAVANRLGIPKVEGIVGTYGQLVPGLLAGRWDMIGASLTISPERCEQILFTDPFFRTKEAALIGYLAGTIKELPKTYLEIVGRFDSIGLSAGSAEIPHFQRAMVTTGKKIELVQFADPQLLVEGLLTKRVPLVTTDTQTMQLLQKQRGGFEVASVDPGHVVRGSGGAFRKEDVEFHDAFVTEQRVLKKSGEIKKILSQFGFEYDADYMDMTGEAACKL